MASEFTTEERRDVLNQEVAARVAEGYRVESMTDHQAVLVKGRRVNHILHLLLSLFTVGLWLVVWLALVVIGGEKRTTIRVDSRGNIFSQ